MAFHASAKSKLESIGVITTSCGHFTLQLRSMGKHVQLQLPKGVVQRTDIGVLGSQAVRLVVHCCVQ
eukprot:976847-Amphidinium_carterae.2